MLMEASLKRELEALTPRKESRANGASSFLGPLVDC